MSFEMDGAGAMQVAVLQSRVGAGEQCRGPDTGHAGVVIGIVSILTMMRVLGMKVIRTAAMRAVEAAAG